MWHGVSLKTAPTLGTQVGERWMFCSNLESLMEVEQAASKYGLTDSHPMSLSTLSAHDFSRGRDLCATSPDFSDCTILTGP